MAYNKLRRQISAALLDEDHDSVDAPVSYMSLVVALLERSLAALGGPVPDQISVPVPIDFVVTTSDAQLEEALFDTKDDIDLPTIPDPIYFKHPAGFHADAIRFQLLRLLLMGAVEEPFPLDAEDCVIKTVLPYPPDYYDPGLLDSVYLQNDPTPDPDDLARAEDEGMILP